MPYGESLERDPIALPNLMSDALLIQERSENAGITFQATYSVPDSDTKIILEQGRGDNFIVGETGTPLEFRIEFVSGRNNFLIQIYELEYSGVVMNSDPSRMNDSESFLNIVAEILQTKSLEANDDISDYLDALSDAVTEIDIESFRMACELEELNIRRESAETIVAIGRVLGNAMAAEGQYTTHLDKLHKTLTDSDDITDGAAARYLSMVANQAIQNHSVTTECLFDFADFTEAKVLSVVEPDGVSRVDVSVAHKLQEDCEMVHNWVLEAARLPEHSQRMRMLHNPELYRKNDQHGADVVRFNRRERRALERLRAQGLLVATTEELLDLRNALDDLLCYTRSV